MFMMMMFDVVVEIHDVAVAVDAIVGEILDYVNDDVSGDDG